MAMESIMQETEIETRTDQFSPADIAKRRDTLRKCATPESRTRLQWLKNSENPSPTMETEKEKFIKSQ